MDFCFVSYVGILKLYHPQCPKFCYAQMLSKLNTIYREVISQHQGALESLCYTLIYPYIVVFSTS